MITTTQPLLRVQDLTTRFKLAAGTVKAVDHVSLELRRGETLGLVGESGCGKSMTALSILRLVQPPGETLGGPVEFNGRYDLLELPEREMRRIRGAEIGFIFQEPMTALDPVYTVGDQIAEAMLVHGRGTRSEARRKAIELLEAVRIPDPERRLRDYPHQLSGGMRQRVLIAIALACQPLLLIADEPTTALDVTIQAEILDLLQEMKEKFHLALLLITHDLGVVSGHADRVAVMHGTNRRRGLGARRVSLPQHHHPRVARVDSGGAPGGRLLGDRRRRANLANLGWLRFEPRCPDRFDLCQTAPPPAYALGRERTARCYLYDPRRG